MQVDYLAVVERDRPVEEQSGPAHSVVDLDSQQVLAGDQIFRDLSVGHFFAVQVKHAGIITLDIKFRIEDIPRQFECKAEVTFRTVGHFFILVPQPAGFGDGSLVNPRFRQWFPDQPVKYWPYDMSHFFISAYAPYVDPSELNADETGIIGISDNTAVPYIEYRRCENPQSCVDLLWYFESLTKIPAATATQARGTMNMKMRHALARLEINVALASAPASGTKVLVEQISLKGRMAKTGRLSLSSQTTETVGEEPNVETKYYPVWSNQTYDKDNGGDDTDHTILIDNDDNNAASYGIIDSPIRYIEGMPYDWQPAGLRADDPETLDKNEGPQNALSTGDRQTYIYLIPQGTLSLEVKVKYHKMTSTGDDEPGEKTTTTAVTTVASPLRGNTTYTLNLTLSNI